MRRQPIYIAWSSGLAHQVQVQPSPRHTARMRIVHSMWVRVSARREHWQSVQGQLFTRTPCCGSTRHHCHGPMAAYLRYIAGSGLFSPASGLGIALVKPVTASGSMSKPWVSMAVVSSGTCSESTMRALTKAACMCVMATGLARAPKPGTPRSARLDTAASATDLQLVLRCKNCMDESSASTWP